MAAQNKITPFARFLIMLLIVTPIAYFGASYYNGEDGIQNIKDFFGGEKTKIETVDSNDLENLSKKELIAKIELLEMQVDQLELTIDNLKSQKE